MTPRQFYAKWSREESPIVSFHDVTFNRWLESDSMRYVGQNGYYLKTTRFDADLRLVLFCPNIVLGQDQHAVEENWM